MTLNQRKKQETQIKITSIQTCPRETHFNAQCPLTARQVPEFYAKLH